MTHLRALLYMLLLIFFTIIFKPFSFLNKKEIWFFIDRPLGIDNSYHLFKYVQDRNNDIHSIYLLKDAEDAKYKQLANNIDTVYNFSFKHFWFFIHASKIVLSYDTKPFFFYKQGLWFKKILKPSTKLVFLGHGVTKGFIEPYLQKHTHFDMFVGVSEIERHFIEQIGYSDEIRITGFPRFDTLMETINKKQILFMPTWSYNLYGKIGKDFTESTYFTGIQGLLNSPELHDILKKYNYELIYAPHYMMERHVHKLKIKGTSVKIIECDLQQCMKEAQLMITDYSSIMFDFAYMKKPSIYYRFSEHHYKEQFNVQKNGFGEIVNNERDCISQINNFLKDGCKIEEKYKKRIKDFFYKIDDQNCKRTYEAIIKL